MTAGAMTGGRRAQRADAVSRADDDRNTVILTFEAAALIAWSGVAWLLSAWFPHPIWSVVSLGTFGWLCALLFRLAPRAAVLAIPDLVIRASTMVALIFIEYGARIPELATVGDAGPYATSFVFYMIVLFGSYVVFFRIFAGRGDRMRQSPLTPLFDRWANWVAIAVVGATAIIILYMLFRGATRGFPLLAGIDRFVYRRQADKVLLYALNLKFVILFTLGMVAFRIPAWAPWRVTAGLSALPLLGVYFLFGDKFFTQIVAAAGFAAPYLYVHYRTARRYLALFLAGGALVLGAVSSVTYYIYSNNGALTPEATMDRLSGRIVGQGELWFLQAKIGAPLVNWDEQFVERNIDALHVQQIDLYAVQQSIGPNYFSNRYAPDKIRLSIAENAGSVTYTAALEPLALAVFGWVGLGLVLVVTGGLMAIAATYAAFAISSRSPLSAVLSGFVSILIRTTITQGTPWVLMSTFAGKWIAVIIVIEIMIYAVGFAQQGPRSLAMPRRGMPGRSRE